jgi:hypothetical protein
MEQRNSIVEGALAIILTEKLLELGLDHSVNDYNAGVPFSFDQGQVEQFSHGCREASLSVSKMGRELK